MSEISIADGVQEIIKRVPEAEHDPKLLILLYWQSIDGIPIPPEVFRRILDEGTSPVTINRYRFRTGSREEASLI